MEGVLSGGGGERNTERAGEEDGGGGGEEGWRARRVREDISQRCEHQPIPL